MNKIVAYIDWNITQPEGGRKLPLVTIWLDLEGILLNETSQTEKDKCCIISLTYGIKKRKRKNQMHRKRDQICGYKRWGVGRGRIGGMWAKGTNFQLQDKVVPGCHAQHDDCSLHCCVLK